MDFCSSVVSLFVMAKGEVSIAICLRQDSQNDDYSAIGLGFKIARTGGRV